MKHWKCTTQPLNLDLLNILPDTQWGVSCIIIASRSSLHFFNECRHLSFSNFDDHPLRNNIFLAYRYSTEYKYLHICYMGHVEIDNQDLADYTFPSIFIACLRIAYSMHFNDSTYFFTHSKF